MYNKKIGLLTQINKKGNIHGLSKIILHYPKLVELRHLETSDLQDQFPRIQFHFIWSI